MRDLVLTQDEVDGVVAGLLISNAASAGTARLSDWLKNNAKNQGRRQASELLRNRQ